MIKPELKIATIQFDIVWNKMAENLSKIDGFLQSMSKDTDVVVLPEMFATGFSVSGKDTAEDVETSVVLNWMIQNASRFQCAISGSIAIVEDGKLYNRFCFVKPDGSIHFYNKRHLFRMSDEPKNYTLGTENVVVEYLGWKFRLAVCYDLRFPVWLKNSLENDGYEYDVLLVVANWPAARSYAWKTLLSARAIENQSFVVGVNRIGTDANGNNHSGDSLVCNYTGEPILDAGSMEGVFECRLSLNDLNKQREQFKVALDWDLFFFML
jgi:omega-amidase